VTAILRSFPNAKKEAVQQLIDVALEVDKEMSQPPSQSLELMSTLSKIAMGIKLSYKLRKMRVYSKMTVEQLLNSLFPGEDLEGLRAALHMMVPLVDFSAIGLLAWLAIGLKEKGCFLYGGAQKTSDAFAEAVVKNGGEIKYSTTVSKITIQNKKAVGVMLENGSELDATTVVAAIDARETFFQLIDPELVPPACKARLESTPITPAVFTVSIVTDIDPSEFGFDASDTWILSSTDISETLGDDPEKIGLRVTFPTLIDPSYRAEGVDKKLHGIQIAANVSFDYENYWRSGPDFQRGDAYREFKKAFASALIKRTERYLLGLSDHILYYDAATPITYYRYTLNYHAAALGWKTFEPWRQRVPFIRGLYRAGMWVGGSSVSGAITSGKNAAELILKNK
jgi:phytoene dehydrogenase-like protein